MHRCKQEILPQQRIVEDHLEEQGEWHERIVESQVLQYETTKRVDASLSALSFVKDQAMFHHQVALISLLLNQNLVHSKLLSKISTLNKLMLIWKT